MMRTILIAFGMIFAFMAIVFATTTGMIIQGGKVSVVAGDLDFGATEIDKVVVSTTTGQCIGILCGVTSTN